MRHVLVPAIALLMLAASPPSLARAEVPAGWRLYPLDQRPPMQASPSGNDGVRLMGEGAISLAVKAMLAWLSPDTCLSWRWRVDAGPPATDLSRRGVDDRALALWVGFRADSETMTLAQRYAYGMIRFLSPVSDPPGFILAYTWGGAVADRRWQPLPQPFMGQLVRQQVLHAAPDRHGEWVEETVPLAADFRAAFGVPPTQVMQLAVFADGDNTASRTDVAIEGMRLHRCGEPASSPAPAAGPTPPAAPGRARPTR